MKITFTKNNVKGFKFAPEIKFVLINFAFFLKK